MANGDTPTTQSLPLDDDARLQELFADPAQRTFALGSAAEQLFTPQLSGQQQTLVQGAIKNRVARGLRGAAAEQFGQQIARQFEEQNRLAAAQFLQQGFAAQAGDLGGQLTGVAGSIVTGGGIGGIQAFGTEIQGLQSIALQGPGKLTEFIEGALQGGDRASALQALFPSLASQEVEDILDPEAAVQRLISEEQGKLQQALAFEGGALRDMQFGESGFQIGTTADADVLGSPLVLQLTQENLQKLGLPDPAEVGGLARLNEIVDLNQRFAEAFPNFPADVNISATAAVAQRGEAGQFNPLTGNIQSGQELVGILEIQPENLTSRLQAIRQVVPSVAEDAEDFARNIETLESFRGQLQNPLQELNILPGLRQQLEGVRGQSPHLAQAAGQEAIQRPQFRARTQDPFQEQLSLFEDQLSRADELREQFFSPTSFFGIS